MDSSRYRVCDLGCGTPTDQWRMSYSLLSQTEIARTRFMHDQIFTNTTKRALLARLFSGRLPTQSFSGLLIDRADFPRMPPRSGPDSELVWGSIWASMGIQFT
jgi:hypothetical protein